MSTTVGDINPTTPERAQRLLDAIERGAVREDLLTSEQLAGATQAAGVAAD